MQLKFFTLLFVGLFLFFFLNGCIFDSRKKINTDNTEIEVPDIEDEFGGYKPTDESAGFGDPEILNEFGEDQDGADLLSTDPQIASYMEDSLVDVYLLRIIWGRLEDDTTTPSVVDWSGSAHVDKGILVLLRTIRFETMDYIHRPRPDRQTLEWTSHTGHDFDGIYIAIIVPPSDTSSAEGAFTFTTTPFSMTFDYSELESIHVIYPVDQGGNEIAFLGHKKQFLPYPCGEGFLDGRWIRTAKNKFEVKGVFKGRWISQDGGLAGHFKGHWGIRRNGEKVLFGKYISFDGKFKGFLKGVWGYSDGSEDAGWFRGRWYDRNHIAEGVFQGHWRTDDKKGHKGFMEGTWKQACP